VSAAGGPLVAKICGLTEPEDAAFALREGADLLGFVVHPPSPRHCADVARAAAPAPERGVLVMVAEAAEPILRAAEASGLRRVQPHLPKAACPEALRRFLAEGLEVLLPWADEPGQGSMGSVGYLWEPSPAVTGLAGGSGQTHAMAFPPPGPFLLAGGLGPDNLAERLAAVPEAARSRLLGVDAASRLEASPGRKDPAKVRAFLQILREWNAPHAHRL
jgi:phosphoribosylanthranilate isomerase